MGYQAQYAGMLKTACDAYKDGYFEEKFVLVSQMDCRSISREDFLKQLQDDCDTIGEGQKSRRTEVICLIASAEFEVR